MSEHRPGPLKQANKAHKTGRHRSKGAIETALKGKVAAKAVSRKHKLEQSKQQRRNHQNQLRKQHREKLLAENRGLGGETGAPYLICVVPMHAGIDAQSAIEILKHADGSEVYAESSQITYLNLPRFKQRLAFVTPATGRGNELAVLDCLKVSDCTLLLTSAAMGEDDLFDQWGLRMFNMMSAQGMPTPVVALMDLLSLNKKYREKTKTTAQKLIASVLPKERIMCLDTNDQASNLLRRLVGQKRNVLHNRDNRPHLLSDYVHYVPTTETLKVTGYLRGTPLDVNALVHIPGLGDFQLQQIDAPHTAVRESLQVTVLLKADAAKQTALQSENVPDPMDAEQTWPTEEEIKLSQIENKKMRRVKQVPKGWSEYQAAWIPDDDAIEVPAESSSENESSENEDEFMSCDEKSNDSEFEQAASDTEDLAETDAMSEAAVNEEKYDLQMDFHEERETLKKLKEARIDQMWPDEIDTPQNVPARERFQKYRGLESFRSSPWDAKENLPADYARIYQFKNFDRTKRRILELAKNVQGVGSGTYVTLHIANVPADKWKDFQLGMQKQNIVVYGLLPHEHQMSLMNVVLKRTADSEAPIKSKERIIFQIGYRRCVVNPIFSQHTNGDKHKFERYFRPHTTLCASFFAPIQFPPAPVLAFKLNPDTSLNMVARGSVLSCNPDRIVLKRIVLSGHPMRINRKSATVRYMFFHKEDVEYFKPVKLRTKCGRVGHIKDSLGTHGHMKCYFDGQLRSHDTVFMQLYKRMYPKWTYEECLVRCEQQNDKAMDIAD